MQGKEVTYERKLYQKPHQAASAMSPQACAEPMIQAIAWEKQGRVSTHLFLLQYIQPAHVIVYSQLCAEGSLLEGFRGPYVM